MQWHLKLWSSLGKLSPVRCRQFLQGGLGGGWAEQDAPCPFAHRTHGADGWGHVTQESGLNAGAAHWVGLCPSVLLLSWRQRQRWRLSSFFKTLAVAETCLLEYEPTTSGVFVVSGTGILHYHFEYNRLNSAQAPLSLSQCRDFATTLCVAVVPKNPPMFCS